MVKKAPWINAHCLWTTLLNGFVSSTRWRSFWRYIYYMRKHEDVWGRLSVSLLGPSYVPLLSHCPDTAHNARFYNRSGLSFTLWSPGRSLIQWTALRTWSVSKFLGACICGRWQLKTTKRCTYYIILLQIIYNTIYLFNFFFLYTLIIHNIYKLKIYNSLRRNNMYNVIIILCTDWAPFLRHGADTIYMPHGK